MDYELSDEQKKYKEEFARFCTEQIAPHCPQIDRGGRQAHKKLKSLHRKLGAFGYLGLSFPDQWGGRGHDLLLQTACDEVLAKVSSSVFLSAYTSAIHCGKLIEHFGTAELKRLVLEGLLAGHTIGSVARTEAQAGSDLGAIVTAATRGNGEVVVSGIKDFCVNGPIAGVFLVVARSVVVPDSKDAGGESGPTVLVVPRDTGGVEVVETVETFGYVGLPIARVRFDSSRLPDRFVVGAEGVGRRIVEESLEWDARGMTSASIGIMARALEASFAYSQERQAFGKAIGSFQEVSFKLAEMRAMLDTARLLAAKAAWLAQEGDPEASVFLSCAKLYASESASKCAGYAVQIHGARGLLKQSVVASLYRDAKYGEIAGGTSEIHRIAIARSVLDAVD